ncbi:MAG: hypothetical protein RR060_07910, partial [Victivallaceae bacterium]
GWITALPGAFMTFIVITYILWISPDHGGPLGFGLELSHAYIAAAFAAFMLLLWSYQHGKALQGKL